VKKRMAKLQKLTNFLDRLDGADIHYTLTSVREGAIVVGVTVPEQRWEIEFMADGDIEVEIFKRDGAIRDFSVIDELFTRATED